MKKITDGFTLLEMLLFITLISLVFVAVTYLVSFSIKNAAVTQHKTLATHYAQELQEWLRGEKEADWNLFQKSGTLCFNTSPITVWGPSGNCSSNYTLGTTPNTIFKRYVTLTNNGGATPTQVTAQIVVEWKEGNNTLQVPLSTVYSVWE